MIIGIAGKKGSGKDTVCHILRYLHQKDDLCLSDFDEYWKFQSPEYKDIPWFWVKKCFADKIKDVVCLLIGCTREQLEDPVFKETPLSEEWWVYRSGDNIYTKEVYDRFAGKHGYPYITQSRLVQTTPRLLLQSLGTEWGRQMIHPDVWVNALMGEYKRSGRCRDRCERSLENGCSEECISDKYCYYSSDPNWIITDVRFPNEVAAIRARGGILIKVSRPAELRGNPNDNHESEIALDNYPSWDYSIYNNGSIEELIEKVRLIKN